MNLDPIAVGAPDECWIWTGQVDRYGYGKARPGKSAEHMGVHRFVYSLHYGAIPEGTPSTIYAKTSSARIPFTSKQYRQRSMSSGAHARWREKMFARIIAPNAAAHTRSNLGEKKAAGDVSVHRAAASTRGYGRDPRRGRLTRVNGNGHVDKGCAEHVIGIVLA